MRPCSSLSALPPPQQHLLSPLGIHQSSLSTLLMIKTEPHAFCSHVQLHLFWLHGTASASFTPFKGQGHLNDALAARSCLCKRLPAVCRCWNDARPCRPDPVPEPHSYLTSKTVSLSKTGILFLFFCSTRGQRRRHCSHHRLHPAAGHLGECALLPLQKGQNLWPIRQTRPVSTANPSV